MISRINLSTYILLLILFSAITTTAQHHVINLGSDRPFISNAIAQNQNIEVTRAEKLLAEGYQLLGEGTKASLEMAIVKLSEARKIFRSHKIQLGEAQALGLLGSVHLSLGLVDKALDYFTKALPLFNAQHDIKSSATLLNNIGVIYQSTGQRQKAIQYFMEALPLLHELNYLPVEATTLHNIAVLYAASGDKQQALEYLTKSLQLARETLDPMIEATILGSLGGVYRTQGEMQKALENYNRALALCQSVEDKVCEATALSDLSSLYRDWGNKEKALEYSNLSLTLYKAVDSPAGEAMVLSKIGILLAETGEPQKSLEYLLKALSLRRQLKDKAGEAVTLNSLGMTYFDMGERQKALEYYAQALSLRREANDRPGEATTLNAMAAGHASMGQHSQAWDEFALALTIYRELNDASGAAKTLNNVGLAYSEMGNQQKALEAYAPALELRRTIKDRTGEATTLNNMGLSYSLLGEKQKALEQYDKALAILKPLGDRARAATTIMNIGSVQNDMGHKQEALDKFNETLPLFRAAKNPLGEATALNNMGNIYHDLGENQLALEYYASALALVRALPDPEREAGTLYNMGAVYADLGDTSKALDYYIKSLELVLKLGNRAAAARTINNVARLYSSWGDLKKALEYHLKALSISREVGDRAAEAAALANVALVEFRLGQTEKALEHSQQGLALARAVNDRSGEAITLLTIAYVQRSLGNLMEALNNAQAALELIESLRSDVVRQDLQRSYFSSVQAYYLLNINLLMSLHKRDRAAGFVDKAFIVSERSRARNLLDLLAEAGADIRKGVDPKLLELDGLVRQQLNARIRQRMEALKRPDGAKQAAEAAKDIARLTKEYEEIAVKIKKNSPAYAALIRPQPLNLEAIQKQLDPDTLLLEYSLADNGSYLWLVSPTTIEGFDLPDRHEIESATHAFYELLSGAGRQNAPGVGNAFPDSEISQTGSRLSQMLLGPVAKHLGSKRLVIVADGALQYLPFAALPDPSSKSGDVKPLIVQHEIVSLPSISVLTTVRTEHATRKSATKDVFVLADPVFAADDERVKNVKQKVEKQQGATALQITSNKLKQAAEDSRALRDGDRLVRLKGTRKEADEILALVPAGNSRAVFDFDANRSLVSSGELSQYRYVIFATHGLLDSIHPELSAIVLSLVDENGNPQDGYLRLHDVYNLNLPAEVVVLSGCQTGLGKEVKGEGLIGMTRGFMYAGAARIVVSLWNVEDDATADLMVRFWRGMVKENKRPSEALRAAQLEMLSAGRWRAPNYWAAFILQGEWR